MDIVLVAGLWLDGSAWDLVVPPLQSFGHRPVPLTLPGQGDGSSSASLGDQVDAVLAAVDTCAGPALVVGHSAASTLAWIAADRRPDKVGHVVMIGGFPSSDGKPYAAFFDAQGGSVPFPGWEAFEEVEFADLDDETRKGVAGTAIPVPEAVTKGLVHLGDVRRFDVPVTLICPEFSPVQARAWIDAGDVPELAQARHVEYVDIDSGHWPMFSRATELAALLAEVARTALTA